MPSNAKIFKEVESIKPDYCVRLENETMLFVFDSVGYGSDGKTYRYTDKEIDEDEFEFLGWQCIEE